MNPLIVIGLLVGIPTMLIVLAQARAALVFMSLCVGSVLSTFLGDQALDMLQLFTKNYGPGMQSGVRLGLLVFPALLTILFLGRTAAGGKWLINLFPALLTGVTAMFLALPVLPETLQAAVYGTSLWDELLQYRELLIGVASLLCLFQLWAGGKNFKHAKKSRHKK
ncbi:hypothetical protein EKI60_00820 [Candidatus Saccharibacteria bacterium]|nr:MAG: hypothetical protein EKI60_00820 [Candidatus Saccharibacteria bacterium]